MKLELEPTSKQCENTCASRHCRESTVETLTASCQSPSTFKLKQNKIKSLPEGSVLVCTLFNALGLTAIVSSHRYSVRHWLRCTSLHLETQACLAVFPGPCPMPPKGTHNSWEGGCVLDLFIGFTPRYVIAPGTVHLWGSLNELKLLLQPFLNIKNILLIHKNITTVDEKVAAASQIAAPTDPGTSVAKARGQ